MRRFKAWVEREWWAPRNELEQIIRCSNYEIRHHPLIKNQDGTTRLPILRVVKGGLNYDEETTRRDGTRGDFFLVGIEVEECLMKHIVWEVQTGQEGWLRFGPSTPVQLTGGEIQKMIREKRAKEDKA